VPAKVIEPALVEAPARAPVEASRLETGDAQAPAPVEALASAPVEPPAAPRASALTPVETLAHASVEKSIPVPVPVEAPAPAPPLESVFANLRGQAFVEQPAPVTAAQFEVALHLLRDGRTEEAIAAFEVAAQAPELRFKAGSGLARLLKARGELAPAIAKFDDALQGIAPSPAARMAVVYDLADALEQMGDLERAFTLFLEVSLDLPQFRDVGERLQRLKHALAARTT
jgi:tetratricopeptide (TPR) repeat protein